MQSFSLRSPVNPCTRHHQFFSSHFLFNLFPIGFLSTVHQNHSVQVTRDVVFKTLLLLFYLHITCLLCIIKQASFTQMALVTSHSPCEFFLPFQLQLLSCFVCFPFCLFLLHSDSYCWIIIGLGLGSSFSFLLTLFKA